MGSFDVINLYCQEEHHEEENHHQHLHHGILNQTTVITTIKQQPQPSSCYNNHVLHQRYHFAYFSTAASSFTTDSSSVKHHHDPHNNILLGHIYPSNNNNKKKNNNNKSNNKNNKTTKATSSSITAIVVLLLVFLPAITRVDTSIITKVKIPPYVILGSTVHLYCVFDLENGTDIYMLKWLKNDKEFYRSVPKAVQRPNRRRMFPIEGVKVDIENSKIIPPYNLHQMALQEVQLSTSGKYTCQITLDAPPFEFVSRSRNMTVISIPERFPVISGNKGHQNYRLGERVQLNCTCYDTHPPANLKWFINDHQVPESYLIHYLPSTSLENEGLFHATLGLDFTVEEIHYQHSSYSAKHFIENSYDDGDDDDNDNEKKFERRGVSEDRELWVKCVATMPPLGANKTVYPYTRNVFLGSLAQSFNRFDSILSSSSSSSSARSSFLFKNGVGINKFNHFCVLLLNAWTVLDSSKLVTLISSSLAVILESSSINNRRSLRHTSTIVVPNSNILLLISTILLLWYYILITSYHAQQTLL